MQKEIQSLRKLVVQKYGGTSVATLERIEAVADHILATANTGHQIIVTVSAMGSHTDDLLRMALTLTARPPQREVDMLLSAGERISMALLSIALQKRGLQATSLTGSQSGILTDETHGNARIRKILGDRIRTALAENKVAILAGFQGVSPITKEITTLGRGGSDLSAIAVAIALGASDCELYKDVVGLHSADPRLVVAARCLEEIDFRSLSELSWAGASVIHARAVHLAAKYDMNFTIRSSFDLAAPGTKVRRLNTVETYQVQALAHAEPVCIVDLEVNLEATKDAFRVQGEVLKHLWAEGHAPLSCQLLTSHAGKDQRSSIRLAIKTSMTNLRTCLASLTTLSNYRLHSDDVAAITMVGSGFKQSPELFDKLYEALGQSPILAEIHDNKIVLIVERANLQNILTNLHKNLVESV